MKKLGSIISAVTGIFLGFSPAFTKEVPQAGGIVQTISKDLAEVGNIVAQIEAIGQLKGLSGPDKAAAAGPLVAQIVLASSLVAGKKIANQDLFNKACTEISGGVADVLNSLHEDSTSTVTVAVGK